MRIQKSGARTGVTTGKIEGIANIKVNGVSFRKVRVESRGFACSGDSGSAVLDRKRNLVGLHFAGEKKKCSDAHFGYFLPMLPGKGARLGGSELIVSFR